MLVKETTERVQDERKTIQNYIFKVLLSQMMQIFCEGSNILFDIILSCHMLLLFSLSAVSKMLSAYADASPNLMAFQV